MNCKDIREHLLDLATDDNNAGLDQVKTHVNGCAHCAAELASLRQTMALMDEWQAPEPTPYFDVRLKARLREEAAKPQGRWMWLRRPALALAMAGLVAVGIGLFQSGDVPPNPNPPNVVPVTTAVAKPGTAVGDLQFLEKNHDLFTNFDVLDEIDHPQGADVSQ